MHRITIANIMFKLKMAYAEFEWTILLMNVSFFVVISFGWIIAAVGSDF